MRVSTAFFLLAVILPLAGCVETVKPREPVNRVDLIVTRSPKGAELHWNTVPGNFYSVQCKARGAKFFEYHPKAINLKATGDHMVFLDDAPDYATRSYRIHPFPVTGKPVPAGPTQP